MGRPVGLRLHGARHSRREARPLHRRVSKWGEVFDHGIDLVHPPFWWWAWEHGLATYGRPLSPIYATMVLWAIVGGYVAQRVIEGLFIKRFGGMHIHVWRPIDSQFRLITARRNPNMVILAAALLFQRPDLGLKLVACWTIVSLIFHAVRLAQASERSIRGQPVSPGSHELDGARCLPGRVPGADPFARSVKRSQGSDRGRAASRWCRARSGRCLQASRSATSSFSRKAPPTCARCCPMTSAFKFAHRGETIASTIADLVAAGRRNFRCW